MSNAKFKQKCQHCTNEYERWRYDIHRKYCSKNCANQGRINKTKLICDNCGIEFLRNPAEIRRQRKHFCSPKCYYTSNSGENSHKWKGGSISQYGYRVIYRERIKIFEHRAIMESYLKRPLEPSEIIHHINGNKLDNRIENLKITTQLHHGTHHCLTKWSRKDAHCLDCGETKRRHEAKGFCSRCYERTRPKKQV